jgi:hypothetical protein
LDWLKLEWMQVFGFAPVDGSFGALGGACSMMGNSRIRSLLDLLRLHTPAYLSLARICEEYTSSAAMLMANTNATPTDEQFVIIMDQFNKILVICKKMQLPVSARCIRRTIDQFSQTRPTAMATKQRYLEWYACFESELADHVYLLVLPHRVGYWSSLTENQQGHQISELVNSLRGFPDAGYDAREAGNCFAFELFTACVYHLMRVAEFALVSIARSVNIDPDRINKGWDGCIGGIQAWINKISSTKPTADWQDQVKKYSDLCAWLTAIQKGWRNPVSHIPRVYSEDSAKAMFSATVTLLDYVSKGGLVQVAMPDSLPVD